DGVRNKTAGEGCDDGDAATGDACGADCQPTVFALDPVMPSDGYASGRVVAVGDRFAVVYGRPVANSLAPKYALFDAKGKQVGTTTTAASGVVTFGIGAAGGGRAVVVWNTSASAGGYRIVAKDGALGATPFATSGFYLTEPGPDGGGGFCALGPSG